MRLRYHLYFLLVEGALSLGAHSLLGIILLQLSRVELGSSEVGKGHSTYHEWERWMGCRNVQMEERLIDNTGKPDSLLNKLLVNRV